MEARLCAEELLYSLENGSQKTPVLERPRDEDQACGRAGIIPQTKGATFFSTKGYVRGGGGLPSHKLLKQPGEVSREATVTVPTQGLSDTRSQRAHGGERGHMHARP